MPLVGEGTLRPAPNHIAEPERLGPRGGAAAWLIVCAGAWVATLASWAFCAVVSTEVERLQQLPHLDVEVAADERRSQLAWCDVEDECAGLP